MLSVSYFGAVWQTVGRVSDMFDTPETQAKDIQSESSHIIIFSQNKLACICFVIKSVFIQDTFQKKNDEGWKDL